MKVNLGLLMACSVSLGAGSIYDFYFLKQSGGHWNAWTEYITKEEETIPANAKVKEMPWLPEFPKCPSRGKNCWREALVCFPVAQP